MRIDFHTHFQCLDFVKHLEGRSRWPKSILNGGSYVIQCAAGFHVPALPQIMDIEAKLRAMDDMDINVAVLSHGIPFGPELLGGQEADDWATRINDDLARIVSCYPSRFAGLGSIGFGDTERSIAEVNRCARQLGFRGFQVFSNISNKPLDSPEVVRVLKHIGALGLPIHLHPAIPLNCVGLDTPSHVLSLGFPYDSSLNAVRLIRSGLFDESPNLKLVVAHIGGVLPYLSGRIATYNAVSSLVPEAPRLQHSIEHYLSSLYVDTVCYHLPALECCYKVVGPERMLYGTDHPFGRCDLCADVVEKLNCPKSHRELIFHGNAERLLGLNVGPVAV